MNKRSVYVHPDRLPGLGIAVFAVSLFRVCAEKSHKVRRYRSFSATNMKWPKIKIFRSQQSYAQRWHEGKKPKTQDRRASLLDAPEYLLYLKICPSRNFTKKGNLRSHLVHLSWVWYGGYQILAGQNDELYLGIEHLISSSRPMDQKTWLHSNC